jgi:tetratricopeptide (TPR) repeat protein
VVTPTATVKESDLPDDPQKLIEYADTAFKKQSVEGVQNSLKALEKARAKNDKSYEVQWRMARGYVWLSEEYDDPGHVEDFSQKAMDAARQAVALEPVHVEGNYYLGTAIGQYVNVKKLKAKDLVPQIVDAAKAAVKADEKFDNAGPLRLLGSVYAQAPEPPTSVGDHDEGVKILARAITLSPNYPQNHLLMGDAQVINRNLEQAEREYNTVLQAEPLPGASWAHRYIKWRVEAQEGLRRINNLRRQNASDRGSPF